MTDDRGQMTEVRRQRSDDRGQMTDDRRQMTDDRSQMTEVRWRRASGRGISIRKSECGSGKDEGWGPVFALRATPWHAESRGQRSDYRGQKTDIRL